MENIADSGCGDLEMASLFWQFDCATGKPAVNWEKTVPNLVKYNASITLLSELLNILSYRLCRYWSNCRYESTCLKIHGNSKDRSRCALCQMPCTSAYVLTFGKYLCRICGKSGHFAIECSDQHDELSQLWRKGYDSASAQDEEISIERFDEAGLPETLLVNLVKTGYYTPRPVQQHCIPLIIGGRDVMACAQTGSGKTAAFLLPVLSSIINQGESTKTTALPKISAPVAVVISPTKAFATKIYNEGLEFSHGTMAKFNLLVYSLRHQEDKLENGCNILVATPGLLVQFVKKRYVSLSKCQFLVLDDADIILKLGFEDAVRWLCDSVMSPNKKCHTIMFSATFADNLRRVSRDCLHNPVLMMMDTPMFESNINSDHGSVARLWQEGTVTSAGTATPVSYYTVDCHVHFAVSNVPELILRLTAHVRLLVSSAKKLIQRALCYCDD